MTLHNHSTPSILESFLPARLKPHTGLKLRARLTMTLMAALALLLSTSSRPGLAQFAGPSLEATTPVNAVMKSTTDPAILYPVDRPFLIGVGDQLGIRVFGVTEFAVPERVGLDGNLVVPLIGNVPVAGITLEQASETIAARLKSAGMYQDPQVTVQLIDSPNQVVTVTGEMHGLIPIIGHRSLMTVLSAAGQFAPTGSHTIIINRPGIKDPIVVDLGTDPYHSAQADVPVFARDTIVVPRVGAVYLLGAFNKQAAIPLQQNSPLTLMQVVSLGGGVLFEGEYKDLRIIRTVGFERKVVKLDMKSVFKGKSPDPVLQADDIIYLPSNTIKAALNNGGFAAITNVAQLALTAFSYGR
jgi:polysaccharide export outer membrane protein